MAFSYKDYIESEEVKRKREEAEKYKNYVASDSVNLAKTALDNHEANRVSDWTGGNYGQTTEKNQKCHFSGIHLPAGHPKLQQHHRPGYHRGGQRGPQHLLRPF